MVLNNQLPAIILQNNQGLRISKPDARPNAPLHIQLEAILPSPFLRTLAHHFRIGFEQRSCSTIRLEVQRSWRLFIPELWCLAAQ